VIRLLVVGEVRLYREGLVHAFANEDAIEVVGTAVGGSDALVQIATLEPQLVLVDLMQGGLELVQALGTSPTATPVLALAVRDSEEEVLACAEAGVAGYVTREASFEDLTAAVASVARGETIATPRMAAALLRRVADLAASRRREAEPASLTAREREVMHLVDRGLTNKEIARALHIELPTVKNHIHHILDKLQVRCRSEAVARLRAAGHIPSS
jgi:two-component system nitrate/nitrite response regulator NarL